MTTATRPTWCGLCHARCGVLLDFEGDKAVAVRGDPDHPTNRGRICQRGRLMLEHLDHPDRINHPLRRVGGRGEGRWERVGWPEAMDEIAERLATLREVLGPESLAMCRGTYRTYHWDARRFMNLFGSPNITGPNAICHCPTVAVEAAVYGAVVQPDLARSACVVIWGSCRSVSSPVTHWQSIRAAKERGAKVITVDPCRTREAEMADLWLQVRPGTDPALMLGWIHVICRDGLVDEEAVERWTVGFEELRELAASWDPERTARATGLRPEEVESSARLYGATRPGVIVWGHGLDKQGVNSANSIHVRAALRAITGNLDVPGGECFGGSAGPGRVISGLDLELNETLAEEKRELLLGGRRHRLFSFEGWQRVADAVGRLPADYLRPPATESVVAAHPHDVFGAMIDGTPYPVKGMICQAANPMLALPDSRRTLEGLGALDLLVVMDYYLTPTAAMADFVLPAASTVERDDLQLSGTSCLALPRGLEPLYERRGDYDLWMELGRRLGQAEQWPWDDARSVCDHRLRPAGLSFTDLLKRGGLTEKAAPGRSRVYGFGTPSGKVELSSSTLAGLGFEPLPGFVAPPEGRDPRRPLLLHAARRFNPMYHSEQRQWPTARKKWPDPLVSIHPDTAEDLGVGEGDDVRIETNDGAIRQRATLTDRVDRGTVEVQHGWWFPERSGVPGEPFGTLESNANVLTSDRPEVCADSTGGWALSGIACRVTKEEAE